MAYHIYIPAGVPLAFPVAGFPSVGPLGIWKMTSVFEAEGGIPHITGFLTSAISAATQIISTHSHMAQRSHTILDGNY